MKRFTSLALAVALVAPIGFAGCDTGEEAKTEITQETPTGETTETVKVEQSGENPPAPVSDAPAPANAPE